MRSLFRRREVALPEAAAGAGERRELAARVEGLPRRLQRIVEQELCPDETVERVILPSAAALARARGWALIQFGSACGLLAFATLTHCFPAALWLSIWALHSLVQLANSRLERAGGAYVITDQRCFHLVRSGARVVVRDVPPAVHDPRLDPDDRRALEARVAELASAGSDARRRDRAERRVARDLPPRLRQAVEEQLTRGETLLWADRPGVREYLLLAPLDWETAGLGLLAGLASVFLAPLMATLGPAEWFHTSVGLAIGLWGATTFRLWRLVRGTVYAVTDRGGFVLAPGGQMRTYSLAEMQRFQRTQNVTGRGTLAPDLPTPGTGFYGVRDVKTVDDLIRGRTTRDQSTEVMPAEALPGRGDELSPAAREEVN
jgi:hypothetical protein